MFWKEKSSGWFFAVGVIFIILLVFHFQRTAAAGLTGDINNDGKVDIIDIGMIIDNYDKSPPPDSKTDLNGDNVVNIIDIGIVLDNYGKNQTQGDPVVMAASDIICDSLTTTGSSCQQMAVSQIFAGQNLAAALIVGDLCHTPSANCFNNVYAPSYGRFKSITYPTTGNHEYLVPGALYYFDYFNGVGNVNGQAGNRSQGYYSFDIGSWHLIALNSQCSEAGGCGAGSSQYAWLQNDLSTHKNICTLAYYHIPVFSSGGRANNNALAIYTLLYNNGVDIVLDGHDHIYERFAPQNPSGVLDSLRGIREFIVGTGGANHTTIAKVAANSEIRNADSFGALKLTLHANAYDWQFMPAAGGNFTDSGSYACH